MADPTDAADLPTDGDPPRKAQPRTESVFEDLPTNKSDLLRRPDQLPERSPTPVSASGDDPMLGRVLGLYRIIERVGRGGMGDVYLATHTNFGGNFALKILTQTTQRTLVRFQREASALSSLEHPNIVDVVDYGSTAEGFNFLVMELVEGVTLREYIATNGAPTHERIAGFIVQIAAALEAAHQVGFIHRDLKPENIICTHSDDGLRLKLLDFGLVGVEGDEAEKRLTQAGTVLGTPGFIAPEQVLDGTMSSKVDMYALGALLYELLAGRPPFRGSFTQVLMKTVHQPPPPLEIDDAPLVELAF